MSVTRYRSVEEMPRPWRDPRDPGNLRLVARMLALHRSLTRTIQRKAGVQRFRSLDDANTSREDPCRR